jgi:hypothetical protein
MSIESIILFFVLLFLSLLGLGIRWLHEKIRRDIAHRDLKDLFPPAGDAREQPGREQPEPTRMAHKPVPPVLTSRISAPSERRRTVRVPRLRNRADLRHGIIIMTVLGPCRALETQHEDHTSFRS